MPRYLLKIVKEDGSEKSEEGFIASSAAGAEILFKQGHLETTVEEVRKAGGVSVRIVDMESKAVHLVDLPPDQADALAAAQAPSVTDMPHDSQGRIVFPQSADALVDKAVAKANESRGGPKVLTSAGPELDAIVDRAIDNRNEVEAQSRRKKTERRTPVSTFSSDDAGLDAVINKTTKELNAGR